MEIKEKHQVRRSRKGINWTFVRHTVIVLASVWLVASQILAVMAIRYLVSTYRFVPMAEVKNVDAVISPIQ